MSLFRAERFVKADVCNSCLADAKALPVPADAIGPSCTNDYFNGAPRVEACNDGRRVGRAAEQAVEGALPDHEE